MFILCSLTFIYVNEVERRQLVFIKITWKSYDGNFMFKDSKRVKPEATNETRTKKRKLKKTYKGRQTQHKKTKEWATRPDLKLEFKSCAPRIYAFPVPLVATIMLLISKIPMTSHKRVRVIVIAFNATFNNIIDISW